jgi:integrase
MTAQLKVVPAAPQIAHTRSTIARAAAGKDTPEKPYEVRATKPLGLLLRVQPSGSRAFYVQVGRGKRIRIGPAGTFTLKQAEERARAILLDPQAFEKRSGHVTLSEYITQHYSDHAEAQLKRGAQSVQRVKTVWKSLLNKRMADITASEVDKLRNKRILAGAAPATVNRDVAALSGVFSHWAASHKGAVHPLHGLSPLQVAEDETIRYLTPSEDKRLRQALHERDEAARAARASGNKWRAERGYEAKPAHGPYSDHITPMVLLSLNTGMRQGELFALTWEQVDLARKTLTVIASHAKGNRTRTIPLNIEAVTVLQAIKPEPAIGLVFKSPITGGEFNNVKKAWAELTKAAKVPDLRWHDLRHDFASQLVMRGVPLFTVQKLLGHANAKMTMRYARLAPDTLASAVEVLTP